MQIINISNCEKILNNDIPIIFFTSGASQTPFNKVHEHVQNAPLEWFSSTPGIGAVHAQALGL